MSSATGDVVTFDSTAVTQPMLAAGDKRQVAEEAAAMSSAGGDVVSFDSTGVTQRKLPTRPSSSSFTNKKLSHDRCRR